MELFDDLFLKPRKDSSVEKRSSSLPPEMLKMITEVISEELLTSDSPYKVKSYGVIYPEEFTVTVSLTDKSGIRPLNFAASIDFSEEKAKENQQYMIDLLDITVDAIGSFIEQFLSAEGDLEVPLDWHEFELEKNKVYLRFHTKNEELEAQANALLGLIENENSDWESLGEEYFKEARARHESGELAQDLEEALSSQNDDDEASKNSQKIHMH